MIDGDRDATSNRKRTVAIWGLLVAAAGAMTTVGVLAIDGPTTRASSPARNGLIVFTGDKGSSSAPREGREDVYTMHRDGTGLRRLTHLHGDEEGPNWSPDGARIAFWKDAGAHVDYSGYVMNADGSDLHQVTGPDTSAEFPAFTPDGHHLVYDCEYALDDQGHRGPCPAGDGSVFVMADDGSDFPGRRLSTNPFPAQSDRSPQVSPDGQTVSFVRIYTVDIDGSHLRRLTTYRLEVVLRYDWAPDGRRIVLTTHGDYPGHKVPNVATMRPDGSRLRMLTHYKSGGNKGAYAGSYSPDGQWIVFRVENLEKERFRLYKMHPDGTHRRLIKRMHFAPRFVDWGPRP
jgi:Tol biopolymer transport system component